MSFSELLTVLAPFICAIGGTALLLLDLAIPKSNKSTTAWLSVGVLLVALLAVPTQWGKSASSFYGMTASDGYALFLDALLLVIGILTVLLTLRYNEARGIMRGEFFALLLFALSGMMLMGHATNLLTVFVAVELLSIPLYILCGIARPRHESEESAMKYFLLGAFASGFLVYGIALIYGAMGTTSLNGIANLLKNSNQYDSGLMLAGAALLLVGLGFKVAAAPFHMWTPDVYEGAPTTVTAFMSTATKAAGFAAILRVFMFGFTDLIQVWQPLIALIAALTMIVGNVLALTQNNLKRLLAYSSIGHAGYLLMGVAAGNDQGIASVLFYLAAYAVTTLAAFAVMTAVGANEAENQSLESYAGLGHRKPVLALVMSIAMLSMLGIPPMVGFFGKWYLIQAAMNSNLNWLAVVAVVTSVISAAFYLRVLTTMFMKESSSDEVIPSNLPRSLATAITAVGTLIAGLFSTPVLNVITDGVKSLVR
jgi:NADH-quinone oxidoreductase subunit N